MRLLTAEGVCRETAAGFPLLSVVICRRSALGAGLLSDLSTSALNCEVGTRTRLELLTPRNVS